MKPVTVGSIQASISAYKIIVNGAIFIITQQYYDGSLVPNNKWIVLKYPDWEDDVYTLRLVGWVKVKPGVTYRTHSTHKLAIEALHRKLNPNTKIKSVKNPITAS